MQDVKQSGRVRPCTQTAQRIHQRRRVVPAIRRIGAQAGEHHLPEAGQDVVAVAHDLIAVQEVFDTSEVSQGWAIPSMLP